MSDLIERLRGSRKDPKVLLLKVLRIRGDAPSTFIFIFEGLEDVPVYEAWIGKIDPGVVYEPVAGAGKEQLLAFRDSVRHSGNPLLANIFFFVDRDFDVAQIASADTFELDAYSIENLICDEVVLESILKDEFKLAGEVALRASIRMHFSKVFNDFLAVARPVNFRLFVARRLQCRVTQKPEKVSDISSIELLRAIASYEKASDVVLSEPEIADVPALRAEYDALPICLQHRGKYLLAMFRRWLSLLYEDSRADQPTIFVSAVNGVRDPSAHPIRRFASCSHPPPSLAQFIGGVKTA